MKNKLLLALTGLCLPLLAAPQLTMEQIMAHPDWIATSPENAFIGLDNRYAYYQRKQLGKELRDWWRVPLSGGESVKLDVDQVAALENDDAVRSSNKRRVAFHNKAGLWLHDNGKLRQLVQGGETLDVLQFIGNDVLAVRVQNQLWFIDVNNGQRRLLADIRLEEKPDEKLKDDYLSAQQRRLFDIVKKRQQRKDDKKAQDNAERTSPVVADEPFYVGKGKEISTFSVSPNGRVLLLGVMDESRDGRPDLMPHYVTEDGFVRGDKVRSKVGSDKADNEIVYWINLVDRTQQVLDKSILIGLDVDPLLDLKRDAAKRLGKAEPKADVPRAVYLNHFSNDGPGVRWNASGDRALLNWFSYDNKDRWLTILNADGKQQLIHRLQDNAWVNDYAFNEMGWLNDDQSVYFTSEETGYSHLYRWQEGKSHALTTGEYEVNSVLLSPDGRHLYFRANKNHPGNHEVYRVSVQSGAIDAMTELGGENEFQLSADGMHLLITHSEMRQPPELYAMRAQTGAKARRLTHTVSDAFSALSWHQAEVVPVPSQHGAKPIYARLYRNSHTAQGEKKPAVMFVHGAGYLQNAHYGWSNYFREYMFHNLLLEQGYVVLDMDYRASAGYGRDWRNAIYQNMGTPELEDYLDGLDYLVKDANVDRQRVGIYGGSYGGFMAFMALFKSDAFAAGAALRPVTDWAHYNHGYTSNILNTPDVDPAAYDRSSPIEFAANLKRPLLICTGMLDDNVFFQDSVRLVQRLIELKIPHFETAIYPIEPHGFREPESWLDEYRRIYRLMENEVKHRKPN